MGIVFVLIIILLTSIFVAATAYYEIKNAPRKKEKYSKRRLVADVKPGEIIVVEWSMIQGRIGEMQCLNNDPLTKKILLQIQWGNKTPSIEKVIFDYRDSALQNFHLLNALAQIPEKEQSDSTDLSTLQKKMNEAIEKEEYEIADELQKKINKLLKK